MHKVKCPGKEFAKLMLRMILEALTVSLVQKLILWPELTTAML
jgi:hypothetical protein